MEKFSYQALSPQGEKCRGYLLAASLSDARQQLREKGLAVITLKKSIKVALPRHSSLSGRELALATRQLATLIAAHLPVDEAVQAVAQQSERKTVVDIFSQLRGMIREGHSLAMALAAFPAVFSRMYCAMVAAGEASGHLPLVLQRLASNEEQSQKLKGKIMQAMIYPVVLTLVAFAVVAILLTAVVPEVIEQFITMKQALPLTTRILIACSDFLRTFGVMLLGGMVALAITNLLWLRDPARLLQRHRQHLRWPLIGRLTLSISTARYARTLSILNASAVPLLDAMRISASVVMNEYARQQLNDAEAKVREGGKVHQSLKATGLFSPMMLHMVASGEQSGCLDEMLERSAELQEEQLSHQITLALALFEPALVVTMASIVLFIILAILQPILQLNEMIG